MKGKKKMVSTEPVGIVIAGTPTPPIGTVFSAYIWGLAPASATEDEPTAN